MTTYIPIPLIVAVLAFLFTVVISITGIIFFFLREFHSSMKDAIKNLTECTNDLKVIITEIKYENSYIMKRLEVLEKIFNKATS